MTGKIVQLFNILKKKAYFPITLTRGVFDDFGNGLDHILSTSVHVDDDDTPIESGDISKVNADKLDGVNASDYALKADLIRSIEKTFVRDSINANAFESYTVCSLSDLNLTKEQVKGVIVYATQNYLTIGACITVNNTLIVSYEAKVALTNVKFTVTVLYH